MSYIGMYTTGGTDFKQVVPGWVDEMQMPDDGRVSEVTFPLLCAVLGKATVEELYIALDAAGYDLRHDKPDEDDSLQMLAGRVTLGGKTVVLGWIVTADGSAYVFQAEQDESKITLSDSILLMWVGARLEQCYQIGRAGKTVTRIHYVDTGPTPIESVMEGPSFNGVVRAAILEQLGYKISKEFCKK